MYISTVEGSAPIVTAEVARKMCATWMRIRVTAECFTHGGSVLNGSRVTRVSPPPLPVARAKIHRHRAREISFLFTACLTPPRLLARGSLQTFQNISRMWC